MTEYVAFCLDNIRKNLTGDSKKDMDYLMECSQKYQRDEEADIILGEIAAMMYELLEESDKKAVSARFEQMQRDTYAKYENVKELVKKGDLLAAKEMLDTVIESVRDSYRENDASVFLSFNHIMEYYLYCYIFKSQKQVLAADIPFHKYYRTKGVILTMMEDYDGAKTALTEALKWNPVDLDTYLSLGETYKHTGELEEFLKITKDCYRYCCTRATMARYYRNMGYYYLQKYEPKLAGALFQYSNIYYPTDSAKEQMKYIEAALNEPIPERNVKELQQLLSGADIPLGPDSDTIGIIYRVGQIMLDENRTKEARDCFSIVYDITQDEEAREVLLRLEQE